MFAGLEQVRNPSGKSAEVAAGDRRKVMDIQSGQGKNVCYFLLMRVLDLVCHESHMYLSNLWHIDCHINFVTVFGHILQT